MTHNLPTESITGQNEWEWNQWRAEIRESSSESSTRSISNRGTSRYRSYPEEIAAFRRKIQEAEVELARCEQQRQYVIDNYERLIDEKNRQLMTSNRSKSTSSERRTLLSMLRRVLSKY